MKTKLNIIFKAVMVLIFAAGGITLKAQTGSIDVEAGKNYRFVLFNDTEIIGRVTYADSSIIKVQTKQGNFNISKDNILYVSTDLTPNKYKYSVSLMGGVSFLNNSGYSYYSRDSEAGPHINLSGMYFMSESKGIKLDASFSISNPNFTDSYVYASSGPEADKFEGGRSTYFSIKPSIVLGAFKPADKVLAYGSLGFGISYLKREAITHTYYYPTYPDTGYEKHVNVTKAFNKVSAIISIGAGLGFRITKNLSILTEAEINVLTVSDNFTTSIPLRIGLSYMLY
jgi:hypothetical protein